MKKTVRFIAGMLLLCAPAADAGYRFYYTESGSTPVADSSVSFESHSDYVTKSGYTSEAELLIKEISASFKSTCYWNVKDDSTSAFLMQSNSNIAFSSKKTATSWLRVAVLPDGTVESTAASSIGFRGVSDKETVTMTPAASHHAVASLSFGSGKSFTIHYGSVNSQSDMGAVTPEISVSATCVKADIDYDFLTNTVKVTETEWSTSGGDDPDPGPVPFPTVSSADCARCFIDNEADKSVTFIFSPSLWNCGSPSRVEVRGSFNGWSTGKHTMEYDSTQKLWFLTLSYPEVKIPGNSGQPEFKFVTNGSSYQDGGSKSFIPEGYVFRNGDNNNIVVFNSDDFDLIKANSAQANKLKSASDFDLNSREGQEEISNFRCVPGTSALFRSYHPYKITKTSNATEPLRMDYLTRLAEQEGINSDICLSENEENNLLSFTIAGKSYKETIAPYYRTIIDEGRVLYTGTVNKSTPSYNEVYYNPTGTKFGVWVKEIVDFINSEKTKAPYLIHCRLGTDRTGMFCATIAALCGAGWEDIAADYQKSNRMGIQEFRDYHLLQYAFQLLLGTDDISNVADVSQGIKDYFLSNGILSQSDISALVAKLNPGLTSIDDVEDFSAQPVKEEWYDLQGIRVENPGQGLYLHRTVNADGSVSCRKVVR